MLQRVTLTIFRSDFICPSKNISCHKGKTNCERSTESQTNKSSHLKEVKVTNLAISELMLKNECHNKTGSNCRIPHIFKVSLLKKFWVCVVTHEYRKSLPEYGCRPFWIKVKKFPSLYNFVAVFLRKFYISDM